MHIGGLPLLSSSSSSSWHMCQKWLFIIDSVSLVHMQVARVHQNKIQFIHIQDLNRKYKWRIYVNDYFPFRGANLRGLIRDDLENSKIELRNWELKIDVKNRFMAGCCRIENRSSGIGFDENCKSFHLSQGPIAEKKISSESACDIELYARSHFVIEFSM